MELTSQKLFNVIKPNIQKRYLAQLLADGLNANISDAVTEFIKDAARCNRFSSDVVYSINDIYKRLEEYRGGYFEPIWIGFRRHGVDGTSFVLSSIDHGSTGEIYSQISKRYFTLYSLTVEPDDSHGFYKVCVSQYFC